MSLRTLLNGATLAAFAVAATVAMGPTKAVAEYPNDKTVLALVPFGAGGGTDRWARVMSSVGFDFFGRGMRVQNRGGAGGTIGWKHMLAKGADGHTVILASPKVAARLHTKPVWIAGAGEAMGHQNMLEMDDFTATSAKRSADAAYTMAGLGPDDMEMALIYDSFTITAAITAEMLGLAPRGEGHTLWKDGHAAPGGRFPINTNGGGLSFNHSGMYGMPLLIEGYRQMSGTAEDGVNGDPGKQTSARTCVVNGTGGHLSTTGTLVLVADD